MRETGSASDSEDVVQEVAASALRALDPGMPRAYLAGGKLLSAAGPQELLGMDAYGVLYR